MTGPQAACGRDHLQHHLKGRLRAGMEPRAAQQAGSRGSLGNGAGARGIDSLGPKLLALDASLEVSHLLSLCLRGKWEFFSQFKAQRG